MKLFRFMSMQELIKYKNGETLINNINHNKDSGLKSSSIGFCFLNYAQYKPEEAYHFILCCNGKLFQYDVCAIFETDRNNVRLTRARYAEPINPNKYYRRLERKSFIAKEYCTTEYSKEKFKLLEYAKPVWTNYDKWNWIPI